MAKKKSMGGKRVRTLREANGREMYGTTEGNADVRDFSPSGSLQEGAAHLKKHEDLLLDALNGESYHKGKRITVDKLFKAHSELRKAGLYTGQEHYEGIAKAAVRLHGVGDSTVVEKGDSVIDRTMGPGVVETGNDKPLGGRQSNLAYVNFTKTPGTTHLVGVAGVDGVSKTRSVSEDQALANIRGNRMWAQEGKPGQGGLGRRVAHFLKGKLHDALGGQAEPYN